MSVQVGDIGRIQRHGHPPFDWGRDFKVTRVYEVDGKTLFSAETIDRATMTIPAPLDDYNNPKPFGYTADGKPILERQETLPHAAEAASYIPEAWWIPAAAK
jgi:hypothetical protein